ncbi:MULTISPECIES: homocysteine S-methyltransferase family protein [Anaeromyxobacter]|uniref:homocysteine S-methyltransferase family protein n=5 Tax=Anaeromyxobacteraceae TaxID=1524215 RepID=UPI001F57876F|nr:MULTISPECIES: homocysteine S-methyltransferase family protein [unclassified Anaeromyxobacter]
MLGPRLLLDGALGTALIARGLPPEALPEEWLLARPGVVRDVHAEHAAAGAGLLLTCTFNLAAPRLAARLDPVRVEALAAAAVRVAREAAPHARVAGALGPTGLAGPGRSAPVRALAAGYGRAARALCAAGADLLWLETQHDRAEARLALVAARATGLEAVVTFTPSGGPPWTLTDGTPVEEALLAMASLGASAAGVNCVAPGAALAELAAWARGALPVPFVAKPSAGLPGAVRAPEAFAADLSPALRAGAALAGGCCGATGDHLRAVAASWRAIA